MSNLSMKGGYCILLPQRIDEPSVLKWYVRKYPFKHMGVYDMSGANDLDVITFNLFGEMCWLILPCVNEPFNPRATHVVQHMVSSEITACFGNVVILKEDWNVFTEREANIVMKECERLLKQTLTRHPLMCFEHESEEEPTLELSDWD